MENAAWRLALGAVRKLHWRTFCEPQKQKGEIKREWKMLLGAWRLAVSDSRYKKLKMITKYVELADRLIVLKKS